MRETRHTPGSTPPEEDDLLRLAREWRDAPGAVPPAEVLDGLRAARKRALAATPVQPSRRAFHAPWYAGAALASFALVALLVSRTGEAPIAPASLEDPVYQALAPDLELLEELEFIAWLAEQPAEDAS